VPNVVTGEKRIEFSREEGFRPLLGIDERAKNVAEAHHAAAVERWCNVPTV